MIKEMIESDRICHIILGWEKPKKIIRELSFRCV